MEKERAKWDRCLDEEFNGGHVEISAETLPHAVCVNVLTKVAS